MHDAEITDNILEIADWTATQMPSIRGDSGNVYTVQNIVNVQTQIVSGSNFQYSYQILYYV